MRPQPCKHFWGRTGLNSQAPSWLPRESNLIISLQPLSANWHFSVNLANSVRRIRGACFNWNNIHTPQTSFTLYYSIAGFSDYVVISNERKCRCYTCWDSTGLRSIGQVWLCWNQLSMQTLQKACSHWGVWTGSWKTPEQIGQTNSSSTL